MIEAEYKCRKSKNIRGERQYVQLTGLGSPQFDNGICVLQDLLELMSKETDSPADTAPMEIGASSGHAALTFSNRLVTSCNELGMDEEATLDDVLDPMGVLAGLMSEDYVYSTENVVKYRERKADR